MCPSYETDGISVGFNAVSALEGSSIGITGGLDIPVLAECRENSLNLGGNTDERFALSFFGLGPF